MPIRPDGEAIALAGEHQFSIPSGTYAFSIAGQGKDGPVTSLLLKVRRLAPQGALRRSSNVAAGDALLNRSTPSASP